MHARIAPSSLSRVIQCPGSLALCESVPPQEDTDDTKAGDAWHWMIAEGGTYSIGHKAPNGWEIDSEMIVSAGVWHATVGDAGMPEIPITIERIHADCWGTPDRHSFEPTGETSGILRVWDAKYGHVPVDPWENWQLIAYCIGLIDMYIALGYREDEMRVDPCIIQPRAYRANGPVKYWRRRDGSLMYATDLRDFAIRANIQVERALQPNAPTKVGPECKYCPARHVCTMLQYAAADAVQYANTASHSQELSSHALGVELTLVSEAIKLLQARKTGLDIQAENFIRTGRSVPGWFLKPTHGKLTWNIPVDEVVKLGDSRHVDLRKPQEAITPTQARDRKLLSAEDLDKVSSRSPGGSKLEQSQPDDGRKIFGAL